MAYNYVNNLGSYPSIPNYQFTNFPYQNVNTGTGNVGGNVVAPISSAVPTLPNSNPAIECDWVTGEDGARSYRDILPGRSKILMDSERSVFYIKTVDYSGVPLPLRIFDFTERVPQVNTGNSPAVIDVPAVEKEQKQTESAKESVINPKDYVTRTEYEELLNLLTAPEKGKK